MTILVRLLGALSSISLLHRAQAALYVNQPLSGATCYGGQPCTVSWLDDGESPLLSEISVCYVGLYNGDGTLVQEIDPVNVNTVHSLTFTPDPNAGPDSGSYYVNFTSVSLLVNQTSHYTDDSVDFSLASMSGSFASPVASDTSTLPIPSSLFSSTSDTPVSTSTTVDSFSSAASVSSGTSASASGLATSRASSPSSSITSPSPSSTAPTSSSKSSAPHNTDTSLGTLPRLLVFGILSPCLLLHLL